MAEIMNTSPKTQTMIQEALTVKAKPNPPVAVPRQDRLKDLVAMPQVREMFKNALQEHADAFLASVIDLYNNDRSLQACNANEVLMEAFKAATLKLPINRQLGFCFIVPFKDNRLGKTVPTFQLGYRGYVQLCMRTGAYKIINAGPVFTGEFIGENRLTGEIDLTGTKINDQIVGFFAYLQTINGFGKGIYWPVEQMNAHAKRYSKSYGTSASPWTSNYSEMATKTILRNLLSKYGVMSVEMQNAYIADIGTAADEQIRDSVADEAVVAVQVQEDTA